MKIGKTSITNRILWIVPVTILLYVFLVGILQLSFEAYGIKALHLTGDLQFVFSAYTVTLAAVVVLLLLCLTKKNRSILRSFLPTRENHDWQLLLWGCLLGFGTNLFCALCALLHGDIALTFSFPLQKLPVLLFALISVFIQSSSEEMWCRGFMQQRINVHYPLWVAAVVNGLVFGGMHLFNPGASVLSVSATCLVGIGYSLLCWYSGSIWTCFGAHTLWNFTQNFLLGLPNSSLVSPLSLFHLVPGSQNTLFYDTTYGVEATLQSLIVHGLLMTGGILFLAHRSGRLGELMMSQEQAEEAAEQTAQ